MMKIETVLAPVDLTVETSREIDVAASVCRTFGARLVLFHNEPDAPPGMSRVWDWKEASRPDRVKPEETFEQIATRLAPEVPVEGVISRGAVLPALRKLARDLPADLVVMGTHGRSTDDHESVVERFIENSPCPVLAVDFEVVDVDGAWTLEGDEDHLVDVLVPTDFSDDSKAAVRYAFDLARRLPLRLRLLHVVSRSSVPAEPIDHTGSAERVPGVDQAYDRLAQLVVPDAAARTTLDVEVGRVPDEIEAAIGRHHPALVVMGEHATGLVRHWLTRDTAAAVLHRSACPVWFVPTSAA